ncbi:MAG: response regulator [Vicingaceae bacterium]|nr:response regulator [Vicingaceae bacterium]
MERINVLYLDDEGINLKAFRATFRRIFNVFTARTSEEGYNILRQFPIEVIIADQRMPSKTGVDFFQSILETYPHPIRILLTAYTDINTVIDAINKGQVYRYVTKPWNDFDLKLTIENAYQLYLLKDQHNKLNAKYHKVFTQATDPIMLFDLKGRIIDYNKAAVSFIMSNPEDSLNLKTFSSFFKNKADIAKVVNKFNEDGYIKDSEYKLVLKNNEVRNCLISVNSINDSYGKPVIFQVIIKDYTEKHRVNKLLLETIINTQEKERERISRDLHDGVGQSLAALKLHIENIKHESIYKEEFNTISNILNETILNLRNICYETLPLVLYDNGLKKAIQDLISKNRSPQLDIHLNCDDNLPELSKHLNIAIFRIIQEFISNTIKHGKASLINISLTLTKENILIELKDNGIGFEIADLCFKNGYGIQNIKSRVESFDGTLVMDSVLKKGTTFSIFIPY